MSDVQRKVFNAFQSAFGRTSQRARLQDIQNEAMELSRATDYAQIKEEAGDLLCSVLALLSEQNLTVEEVVNATLEKIERRKQQYKSLGRKLQVALLGGAFDPPTLGHIDVAQFVLDTSRKFDEVWLVPCFLHLYGKQMADSNHRLKMCELASKQDGRIKVFDFEIQHRLRGETYYFLKNLLEAPIAQECNFSYIIGMDNANSFDRWINYEDLERLIPFVVVPRQGEQQDPSVDWYLKPPHVWLRPDDERVIRNTASSRAREALRDGDLLYASTCLSVPVLDYISDNGLYSAQSKER